MMRLIRIAKYIIACIFLAGILIQSKETKASHSSGMEMFYRWKNDSTYEFTMIFYRNCQGFTANAPSNVSIVYSSASKNISNQFFTCQQLPTVGPNVPALSPPGIFECFTASAACVEEYVYRGSWTSPVRANDWIFYYELCCMSVTNAPENVQNGTMRAECGLNNLDFPDTLHQNLSGIFHNRRPNHPGHQFDTIKNPPIVSLCEGRSAQLDQSVRNYDGDSISYELFWVQTAGGVPIGYINGWSFANPMPSSTGPLSIDSLTGVIDFIPATPTGSGIYLIGVKATEYRKDTTGPTDTMKIIGFVKRNFTIYLTSAALCPGDSFYYANEAGMNTNEIEYDCPDQAFEIRFTKQFLCSSLDTNGSDVLIRHPASNTIIPVIKTLSTACNQGQLSDRFKVYLDTIIQPDTFELIIKQGNDSNTLITQCRSEIQAYADTLKIVFLAPTVGELLGDKIGPNNFSSILEVDCGENFFVVNFSEKVLCSSIASDGSDFEVYNIATQSTVPMSGLVKYCVSNLTSKVLISTTVMDPGNYWVRLKTGSDSNRVSNRCYNEWAKDSILLVSSALEPDLGKDTIKCEEDSNFQYFLNPGKFFSYYWSTGSTSPSILVHIPSTYWVIVYNEYGCSETDSMILGEKKCYVGLNTSNESELEIYPNPISSTLFIKSNDHLNKEQIQIFSLVGKRVNFEIKNSGSTAELNLGSIENGIYFVKIDFGDQQVTKKIMVNKN